MLYQITYHSQHHGRQTRKVQAITRLQAMNAIWDSAAPQDQIYGMCVKLIKEDTNPALPAKRCDILDGVNYILPSGKRVYSDLHLINLDPQKMTAAERARAEYDRKKFIREWSLNPERLGEIVADEVAA